MTNFWLISLVWFKISQPVLLWFQPRSFFKISCVQQLCACQCWKKSETNTFVLSISLCFFLSNTAYFEAILPSVHDVSCKQSWVSLFEGVFGEKSVAKEEAIPVSATALTSGGLSAPQLQVTAFFSTGNYFELLLLPLTSIFISLVQIRNQICCLRRAFWWM